jgi:hypothetical protein
MPYCRKCGTKLDETARFCPVCGTPVATVPLATSQTARTTRTRRPVYVLPIVILATVLILALVIGALFFVPLNPVHFNQTNQVPQTAVHNLFMDFQVDVGQVNVFFENLPGNMAVLNVTAEGSVGVFEDANHPVNVTFSHQATNNSEVVIAGVSRTSRWPISYGLNVKCDVYINPSTNVTLRIHSSVGNIAVDTDANAKVTLQRLDLETTTGDIEVSLSKDAVVAGAVSLQTTTGAVQFSMDEADVSGNVSVNLRSTTGAVNADLTATQRLSGNVTVNGRSTTGSVNLHMAIDSDVGARIESDAGLGGITLDVKRFSGNKSPIQSDNYPAGSNFLVNLKTETGGININAAYGSSSVQI